ncbi:hypothetical protein [Sphaerisporangium krabiense]|uniref:Ethanolamine utilization protein EutQ (Cupin superfamily) n=1 Tax=Sphaerisporangium krabiense TaxID=763782 RepID=A0A7W8Z0H4_9ACTN|nr:hypothetical protein [Sphaerisporangium krabiense]MBB5625130.1 ethanolamine utilization protein EutQ (cupin superfamily) [Sphaerisporangium krabiense]
MSLTIKTPTHAGLLPNPTEDVGLAAAPIRRRVISRWEDGADAVDGCYNEYVGPRVAGPVVYPGYVEVCYLPKGDHVQLTASGKVVEVREGSFAIRLRGSTSFVIIPQALTSVCFFSPGRPRDWGGRGVASQEAVLADPLFVHPDDCAEFDDPDAGVVGTVRSREVMSHEVCERVSVRWTRMDAGAVLNGAACGADRMVYVVEGTIVLRDADGEHSAGTGSFIQWPPDDALTISASEPATFFTLSAPGGVAAA